MKVKRSIAFVLLFALVLPFFNIEKVQADSNDRRRTSLNLAAGVGLTDIDDVSSIDTASLQTIALYLSNFYIPFVTILDGDYDEGSIEDTGNKSHVNEMIDALVKNAGFKKETAEYLVGYCLEQSLNTCHQLMVREEDLDLIFEYTECLGARGYDGIDKRVSAGFIGRRTVAPEKNSTAQVTTFKPVRNGGGTYSSTVIYATKNTVTSERDDVQEDSSKFDEAEEASFYEKADNRGKTADNYKALANKVTVGGHTYVQISYALFLQYIDYCYRIANNAPYVVLAGVNAGGSAGEAASGEAIAGSESWAEMIKTASGRYKINRILDDGSKVSVDMPVVNFYFIADDRTPHVVFSTSEECMTSFLMVNSGNDVNNGYGSAFLSISNTEIESLKNPEVGVVSLASQPNMYVNWVGDLILDNGVYRTVVLPGCANPHMLTKIGTSSADSVPMQNVYALSNIQDGVENKLPWVVDGSGNAVEVQSRAVSMYIGKNSMFLIKAWRRNYNSADSKMDASWKPGWGTDSSLLDLLNSSTFLNVAPQSIIAGGDFINFPSMSHLVLENRRNDKKPYIIRKDVYSKYEIVDDSAGVDSNTGVEQYYAGRMSKDNYMCLGYDPVLGRVPLNSEMVFLDSFSGVSENAKVSDLFPKFDIYDMLPKLQQYTVNTRATFTNILTKGGQGHSAQYSPSTKALFQSLYFTYCFACFNQDSKEYTDENVVDLKINFKDFPGADVAIDWSALETDKVQDEVLSFVYYLLHPTKGIGYVATWFKNKVSGILVGWHEDVVGSSDSNSSTGMTKYLGTSSYTTTPGLHDVSWIAKILDSYNNIIVYIIILVCLILLCYVLVGSMTIQRGIVGVVMFGLLAFLPPLAINTTVNAVNTVSDRVYSRKFDYWALCQLQTFLMQMDSAMDAAESGDFMTYASFVISNQTVMSDGVGGTSETFYSGVKLKWMAPKKFNSVASLASAMDNNTVIANSEANFLKRSLLNAAYKATSGETFLENNDALYLYRDYSDIYRYAMANYNILSTFNFDGSLLTDAEYNRSQTMPLGFWNNDIYSTTAGEWDNTNGLGLAVFGNSAGGGVGNLLGDDDAYILSNSIKAIENGFMFNTIGFNTDDLEYDDLVKFQDPYWYSTDATRRTLATSYPIQYNATYKEVHRKLEQLNRVVQGEAQVNIGSPQDYLEGYYNFGLTRATLEASRKRESSAEYLTNAEDLALIPRQYGSFLWGYQEIIGLEIQEYKKGSDLASIVNRERIYENLSDVFYGLYSESPFYYFNNNIRDQLLAANSMSDRYNTHYSFDYSSLSSSGQGGSMNNLCSLFLNDRQSYFYNLEEFAGDGYGELRDFMNMHDFFWYVVPYLRDGVDLARMYDAAFGLYADDDCSLRIEPDGSFSYDNVKYGSLHDFRDYLTGVDSDGNPNMTDEQKYKFWHTYNTYSILAAYTPWLDAMMDCEYANSEKIHVLGDEFVVSNPLDPNTYFEFDDTTAEVTKGRFMVFSRSEMAYYGLNLTDLTTVERKIISLQDSVYEKALELMNYSTLSDETLIQAYAMLQLFEFNKEFSQNRIGKADYILYPQGYELKAFTYDAYLRMVVSESSGESLMTSGDESGMNESIYRRVLNNTSLFFGLFLLVNDVLAVYAIPGLKLFFLICIFFTSIAIILAAVVKMDLNVFGVAWKSLLMPLGSFALVSIGMSVLVSMFMGTGATGITGSEFVINMGDPTSALIVMLIINVMVTVLYFKICKKCFHDFKVYVKAVADNMGSAIAGAFGTAASVLSGGKHRPLARVGSSDFSGFAGSASSATQRGRDNSPRSGRSGIGTAALAAGLGGMAGMGMMKKNALEKEAENIAADRRENLASMNRYDRKAYLKAGAKTDEAMAKQRKAEREYNKAVKNGMNEDSRRFKRLEAAKNRAKANAEHAYDRETYIETNGKFGSIKHKLKDGYYGEGLGLAISNRLSPLKDVSAVVGDGANNVWNATGKVALRGANAVKKGATNLAIRYDVSGVSGVVDSVKVNAKAGLKRAKAATGSSYDSARKAVSSNKKEYKKARENS